MYVCAVFVFQQTLNGESFIVELNTGLCVYSSFLYSLCTNQTTWL